MLCRDSLCIFGVAATIDEIAVRWGCKIAVDSGAQATGQLEWQPYGADKAARCGVEIDNIIDTWRPEDLLAWTASHNAA